LKKNTYIFTVRHGWARDVEARDRVTRRDVGGSRDVTVIDT